MDNLRWQYSAPQPQPLAPAGHTVGTLTGYEAISATLVRWTVQPAGNFEPLTFETTTTAQRGNRLYCLLASCEYSIDAGGLERFDPAWLIGLAIRVHVTHTRDPLTGAIGAAVEPCGITDTNPHPLPWQEPFPAPRSQQWGERNRTTVAINHV